MSTLDPGHANLLRINVSSLQGFSQIIVQTVKNRGADVGQFLQQIQATTVQNFDAILKIHTKSDRQHRQWMLSHLCGTPQAASIPSTLALYKTYQTVSAELLAAKAVGGGAAVGGSTFLKVAGGVANIAAGWLELGIGINRLVNGSHSSGWRGGNQAASGLHGGNRGDLCWNVCSRGPDL